MGPGAEDDPKSMAIAHRGRMAFGEGAEFENLWRRLIEGWSFTKTPLTEAYTFAKWRESVDEQTMPVLLLKGDGKARFLSGQSEPEAEPGDVLVCFGPPRPVEQPAPAA